MIRGIIFDCDGVIIDTEQAWDESNRIFLARRGATYIRDVHKPQLTGRAATEGVEVLQSIFGFGGDAVALAEERRELVRAQLDEVRLIPGFEAFFSWAVSRFRVAVATGMETPMFEFVDAKIGLSEMFGGNVVVSSSVPRSKPAPDLFLAAARLMGLSPGSCLVIEDAPLGIEAARRAAMTSIGLATTYPKSLLQEATAVAADWSEAHVIIQGMLPHPTDGDMLG